VENEDDKKGKKKTSCKRRKNKDEENTYNVKKEGDIEIKDRKSL
jgi:hypothetical protein